MQIDRNSLERASKAGIISDKESQALWKFLLEHNKDIPSFNFTHSMCSGLGVAIYSGDLSYHLFRNSYLFPIFLTLIGFRIIYLGLLWNKHGDRIGNQLRSYLLRDFQELVARRLD